jgi:neurotransmitter:Na+ symporter, NSS family
VVGLDTAVGLLAGLITFPVVVSFGLQETVSEETVGALFLAIPTGLASLGPAGRLVAVLFFSLAYLAAITSSVSLLEVPVASLMDRLGWSRRRSAWLMALLIFIAGLPAAMSIPVLEVMDSIFGGVLLILGGLLIALLVGWVVPKRFQDDLQGSKTSASLVRLMLFFLRWVSPVVITAGLLISVVDLWRQWFPVA